MLPADAGLPINLGVELVCAERARVVYKRRRPVLTAHVRRRLDRSAQRPGFMWSRRSIPCMGEPASSVRVTVLVDGIPGAEQMLDGKAVARRIIGGLFAQEAGAGDCRPSARDGPVLGPSSVLEDDGIPGGPVPALAKKNGGGGAWSGR